MKYLLTMKTSIDGNIHSQKILNEEETTGVLTKAFSRLMRIEETSAHLKAQKLMQDVHLGTPKVIENAETGHVLVVQQYTKETQQS